MKSRVVLHCRVGPHTSPLVKVYASCLKLTIVSTLQGLMFLVGAHESAPGEHAISLLSNGLTQGEKRRCCARLDILYAQSDGRMHFLYCTSFD